jgi:two-component system, OmpR family, sensor histidine kinase KdpD
LLQDQRDPHVSRLEWHARHNCAKRGKLRLFFGGSAGLTAVRTMLETAKAVQQTGVDVVVGRVNFCGRKHHHVLPIQKYFLSGDLT